MTEGPSLSQLVHEGDLAGLVAEVDRRANRADWDGLFVLRDACLRAVEDAGRQLWGPAQYAEYRLALEAPASRAAEVVVPGGGRFALGPLTEVVAQAHRWGELADHLAPPVVAATVAQERVLRGEDLTGDARAHPDELGLPLALQPWEPDYPLPTYRADELSENGPEDPGPGDLVPPAEPGRPVSNPELVRALRELTSVWEDQSTGEVDVAVVEGPAAAAIAAVADTDVTCRTAGLGEAFAHMAWAAASGGALGRRRGLAAGRAAAFWAGHVLTDLTFPADPDDLEFALEELDWLLFRSGDAGWRLQLAVADPTAGWAAAIDARDRLIPPGGISTVGV